MGGCIKFNYLLVFYVGCSYVLEGRFVWFFLDSWVDVRFCDVGIVRFCEWVIGGALVIWVASLGGSLFVHVAS